MAEEENLAGTGQPERGKEQSIFPLTKEAVDEGLANIAEDPYLALLNETGTMSIQNRNLFRGLHELMDVLPDEKGKFVEGAIWTYLLLRKQAELQGRSVPTVSNDIWNAHKHDQLEELRIAGETDPHPGRSRLIMQQMETISAQDTEFGRAMQEITKYNPGKPYIFHGAINTYLPAQKAIQAQELERKLGDQ